MLPVFVREGVELYHKHGSLKFHFESNGHAVDFCDTRGSARGRKTTQRRGRELAEYNRERKDSGFLVLSLELVLILGEILGRGKLGDSTWLGLTRHVDSVHADL